MARFFGRSPDHFLGHFHPSVISIGIEGSEGSGFGS